MPIKQLEKVKAENIQKDKDLKQTLQQVTSKNKLMEKTTKSLQAAQTAQNQAQTALKKLQEAGFLREIVQSPITIR